MTVTEGWHLQNAPDHTYAANEVSTLLQNRLDHATHETWFTSDRGRLLMVVTNGDRAMVMLLDEPGDSGEHLVDPQADDGDSDGFILTNGQWDTYPDQHTVPFRVAARAVAHLVDHGTRPDDVTVENDR